MENDCHQYVKKCHKCQIHANLIHVPPALLHNLTSPWPFCTWGIDIIGKVTPKASNGHEYILVAIDYFTKWEEAASYRTLTSAKVAKFIKENRICRYGVPHELISDLGSHFKKEVEQLCIRYQIQQHKSSPYRPQTNGAVEAAKKNIGQILRKMTDTYRDWPEKLPLALWGYRTSIRTSTGATRMEAVLPVELEVPSLRVTLESEIPEAEWTGGRFEQLNLIEEQRMKALNRL